MEQLRRITHYLDAEEIIELTGTKSQIIFNELPVNDPKQRNPDIARAIEILGWEPKIKRSEGLQLTLNYFKSLKELSSNDKIID